MITNLLIVFVTCLSLFSSCSANRVELLNTRLEQFNEARHWGATAQIKSCLGPKHRSELYASMTDDLDEEKIVDYSVMDIGLDEKKKKASSIIRYTYYLNSTQDVKHRDELIEWEYDGSKKNWYIYNRILKGAPKPNP